ncbi:hypothetical protein BHM03_00039515 [Ensete ventricosum]|nr:hypothetical protein BHM03_00039515 [Ensete ventricosum]
MRPCKVGGVVQWPKELCKAHRGECNKFSTLLDLEGCSEDYIGEGSQSTKCICEGRTRHKLFIDPLLSWRESIGRKRDRGDEKCRGKLQVPRQGGRAEAKELHKTDTDGLLIKIAESEGLRVDAGVFDQGTK